MVLLNRTARCSADSNPKRGGIFGQYMGSTNQNFIQDELNVDLRQEIHVIIQSKHSCLLDFSLRI